MKEVNNSSRELDDTFRAAQLARDRWLEIEQVWCAECKVVVEPEGHLDVQGISSRCPICNTILPDK